MRRMTKVERSKMFELILQSCGPYCQVGGEEGDRETLFLIPWDTDPKNRDPDNWRIICERIAPLFNPSAGRRRKKQAPSINKSVCENATPSASELPRNTSLEFLKHLKAEPLFNHWLFAQVFVREKIPYREVLNGGAFEARITQKTSREYIDKQSSPQGMYAVVQDSDQKFIRLKPQWESFRKVVEARRTLDRQARNPRDPRTDGLQIITGESRPKTDRPDFGQSSEHPPPIAEHTPSTAGPSQSRPHGCERTPKRS